MYVVTQFPYNADNTGATDARAAIQAAIDDASAASSPGGVVYFPAGLYRIDLASGVGLQLKSKIQYVGEGWGNTTLRLGNSLGGDLLRVVAAGSDIALRELRLDLGGLASAEHQALNLVKATRIQLQRVAFDTGSADVKSVALAIGPGDNGSAVSEVSVQGCSFVQAGARAIFVRAGTRRLSVTGCTFSRGASGSTYTALHVEDDSTSTSSTPRIEGIQFVQNLIRDDLDLVIQGRLLSASGFYPVVDVLLAHNRSAGHVTLEAVRGARILSNTLRATSASPLVIRRSRQVRVAGNRVVATAGPCIHIDGKAPGGVMFDFPVEDVQVMGNTLTQSHVTSVGLLLENIERGIVTRNLVTFPGAPLLTSPAIYHVAGPNISDVAPSTRRSVLVAQNIVRGFLSGFYFGRYKDALLEGLVVANQPFEGSAGASSNTAVTFNPSSHVTRLVLHGIIAGPPVTTSLSAPPASLAAGMLGEDSGDTTGVGMYVCTAASNAPYIQSASKGSLYVDRDATAPGATLFVRQSNGWVPK